MKSTIAKLFLVSFAFTLVFTSCFKDDLLKEIDALKDTVSSMQRRNDSLSFFINAKADSLGKALTAAQKRSDSLASVLKTKSDSLSIALGITNSNLNALTKSVDSIKVQVGNINGQLTQLNNQLTSITSQLTQLNQQFGALGADYAALNSKYQELSATLQGLNTQIAALQAEQLKLLEKLNAILLQITPPADITTGLVAYYPFNGNLLDSNVTATKRDGIPGGTITYTADRFGNPSRSIGFSSAAVGYVKTPSSINDLANTFTISCWVNPLSTDRVIPEGITGSEGYGTQLIVHPTHGGAWGNASQNAGVGFSVGKNQITVVEHSHLYIASPLVYPASLNGWHLVTIVYENHIPKLYVDGALVKTGKASSIANVRPSNGNDINNGFGNYSSSGIGNGFSPSGTPPIPQFNGSIDEFRIYNRALTQTEISYLASH